MSGRLNGEWVDNMSGHLFKSADYIYYREDKLSSCGFKSVGKDVMIHETAIIHGFENISIGSNVRIDPFVTIVATGPVTIGSFVHIGSHSLLLGREGIEMHDFSGLSQYVKVYTVSDDYSGQYLTNPTVPEKYTGGNCATLASFGFQFLQR